MSCLTFTEIFQFSQSSQVSKVLKIIFIKHQKDIVEIITSGQRVTSSNDTSSKVAKKSRCRKYFTYKVSPYPMAYHFIEKPILKHFVT